MEVVKRSAALWATSSPTNWISSTGGIFSWSDPFRYATRALQFPPLEHRLGLSAFHQQLALVAKPQDVAVKSYRTIQVADSQPDVINLPNHFFLLPGFLPDSIKGQNERSNLVGVTLMEVAPYQLVAAMPESMPAA